MIPAELARIGLGVLTPLKNISLRLDVLGGT